MIQYTLYYLYYINGVYMILYRTQNVASMKRVTPAEARQSVVGVYRNPMFSANSQEQLNVP